MTKIRTALALISVVLLMAGYFASQFLQANGAANSYIVALDKSSVPYLSLALFVGAIVFGALPVKEETP